MIHAIIAGNEIENVDPNKMLTIKMVDAQNITFGEVSEWLYRGKNSITNVKKHTTEKNEEKKTTNSISSTKWTFGRFCSFNSFVFKRKTMKSF